MSLFSKILRAGEGKALKELEQIAAQINSIESRFEAMSDHELKAQTPAFREQKLLEASFALEGAIGFDGSKAKARV